VQEKSKILDMGTQKIKESQEISKYIKKHPQENR
jgi:hypothetical protein